MIVRPSLREIVHYGSGMQCAPGGHVAVPGIISGRTVEFEPLLLANAVHDWDMEGPITQSGDVSQVDDQIGTDDLTAGSHNEPLYVASEGTFAGRKAARHDPSNSESLGHTVFTTITQPFTMWGILLHDLLEGDQGLFANANIDAAFTFETASDLWVIKDDSGNSRESTVTTPATGVAYLAIAVFDGASSELYINNVDQSVNGTTAGTSSMTGFIIGIDVDSNYADLAWTRCGIVDASMAVGDRSSLYTWAQDNAGVV